MARKRARRVRSHGLPASRKARRDRPPVLGPWDPHELRTLAEAVALRLRIDAVSARYVALHALELWQVEQVLKGLGCDPSTPDWKSAFFKLARHCCNVGQVRQARGSSTSTIKWTSDKDIKLVMEVAVLRSREKISERAAIKKIANDRAYDNVFPYEEVVDGFRVKSRRRPKEISRRRDAEETFREISRRRREDGLRQRLARLKRNRSGGPSDALMGTITQLAGPSDAIMRIITKLDIFPEPEAQAHKSGLPDNESDLC